MKRTEDGGKGESKDIVVSEGTFMTEKVRSCIVGIWGLINIRAIGSNSNKFMQGNQDHICDF